MELHVYQARNGKIYVRNGSRVAPLTKAQIDALMLDIFSLDEFNFDDYKAAYTEATDEQA